MANITDSTASNVFYQARLEAAKKNECLSSREGASDLLSIDNGRLYRIERGVTTPYPEEVFLMSDLYHAPELRNYYCTELCQLGCDIPKAEIADLDRISIGVISAIRKMGETRDLLLDVSADGIVDETERIDREKVIRNLETLEQLTQSLKLWVKKNLE